MSDDLTLIAYNYLLTRFEGATHLSAGKLRAWNGATVENLVDIIFSACKDKYLNNELTITVGSKSPIILIDENNNSIAESVDRHIYKNGDIICVIECKTYLDKCYMQRADSDFHYMKKYMPNSTDRIIVSLENSIADSSYNFFLNQDNITKVFYLASGKRNSSANKRIYYHPERLQFNLIEAFVSYIENLFIEK